jgi:hypothetical protein
MESVAILEDTRVGNQRDAPRDERLADRDAVNLTGTVCNVQVKRAPLFFTSNFVSRSPAVVHDARLAHQKNEVLFQVLVVQRIYAIVHVELGAGFLGSDTGPHVREQFEKTPPVTRTVTKPVWVSSDRFPRKHVDPDTVGNNLVVWSRTENFFVLVKVKLRLEKECRNFVNKGSVRVSKYEDIVVVIDPQLVSLDVKGQTAIDS